MESVKDEDVVIRDMAEKMLFPQYCTRVQLKMF